MITLSIDIETFSSVDLIKSGVYPYTEAPDFEILLFAYAFDDEPVDIIDLVSQPSLPEKIVTALHDKSVKKTAFNANFERTCISKYLGIYLPVEQWECTAVHALMLGLPGTLEKAAEVLKLQQQKLAGKPLINYFSKPCKPTKANGNRERNYPEHDTEKWELFKEYCKQDVEVERALKNKLSFYKITDFERKLWHIDQDINDRGVCVDGDMVRCALECDREYSEILTDKAKSLTGLDNPNSVSQLKNWIESKTGTVIKSLNKDTVQELLNEIKDPEVKEALKLRVRMSKTSVKKYEAMDRALCSDGRIRGLLQYYGANRTGRWAGRIVQVQNLPQNKIPDLDLARSILKSGDYEKLELFYGATANILSQLIRTAFIAKPRHRFIVADFSAIEARVIAWLADEKWRLDVFNTHGKIYEASAAQMFHVHIEYITKGSRLRQKGKVAELALGYQGGVGALVQMGALDMGLSEKELPRLVASWRKANPKIVKFWSTVEKAVIKAIDDKTSVEIKHGIKFIYEKGILFIQLPSGRRLPYLKAKTETSGGCGNKKIKYEGLNQTSKKWEEQETYGGKLVENIVQAVARDCLAEAMVALTEAGYEIVMHIHDEVVIDAEYKDGDMEEVNVIMGRQIKWAPGLPLTADAYETTYYRKD